jgi:hypothetical protein
MSAVVGLLRVHLHLPGLHSLKEKRMVLRRLKDRLKKLNVAVAETDHQDLWQRAELAIVAVSNEAARVDQMLASVEQEIERVEPGLITDAQVEFLR